MAEKTLMYRKTMLKQIYRLSELLDEVLKYDEFKDMILKDKKTNYKYSKYLKNIFDCYLYLLLETNSNRLSIKTLNDLYKIIFKRNLSITKLNKLGYLFNNLENKEEQLKVLLKITQEKDKVEEYICVYLMIAYTDYLKEQKIFNYSPKFFQTLFEMVQNQKDYELLIEMIQEEKKNMLPDDEAYFDNLRELTKDEIINHLVANKQEIEKKYKINGLYLFGSFSKNKQRIDSDIDLVGVFSTYLTYKEKKQCVEEFKEYIKETFARRCDFAEYYQGVFKEEYHMKLY